MALAISFVVERNGNIAFYCILLHMEVHCMSSKCSHQTTESRQLVRKPPEDLGVSGLRELHIQQYQFHGVQAASNFQIPALLVISYYGLRQKLELKFACGMISRQDFNLKAIRCGFISACGLHNYTLKSIDGLKLGLKNIQNNFYVRE